MFVVERMVVVTPAQSPRMKRGVQGMENALADHALSQNLELGPMRTPTLTNMPVSSLVSPIKQRVSWPGVGSNDLSV